jgi:trans-aconitate methyltransferase
MRLPKTTKQWSRWWADRKCDWAHAYGSTVNHPHRDLVLRSLESLRPFGSVFEFGCATGPNLVRVARRWPDTVVGGFDVSADAVAEAKRTLPNGHFSVDSVMSSFYSDQSSDVVMSDACLIYVSDRDIRRALGEMHRMCRRGIVLCEMHEPNWLRRLAIRLTSGYYAHDYRKLLAAAGFHDVQAVKIGSVWPGLPWGEWGYVITARKV